MNIVILTVKGSIHQMTVNRSNNDNSPPVNDIIFKNDTTTYKKKTLLYSTLLW